MNNTITTTSSPTITFGSDADTGFYTTGDLILVAGGADGKHLDNYKKVHVARRRQAKKASRPVIWRLEDVINTTTLTVSRDP